MGFGYEVKGVIAGDFKDLTIEEHLRVYVHGKSKYVVGFKDTYIKKKKL